MGRRVGIAVAALAARDRAAVGPDLPDFGRVHTWPFDLAAVMTGDSSTSTDTANGNAEPAETVRLSSWVTVKRTERMYGQGAYGTRGILALTDTKLVFLTGGQTQWELDRATIDNLKRPRWAIGSYLTFEVNGAFYGVAFGGKGLPSLVSGSDLAIRVAAAGAGAGALGDAVAVAGMHSTTKLTQRWFDLLNGKS